MREFELIFESKMKEVLGTIDHAHDINHVKRVVSLAKEIQLTEGGKLDVILPAAWLHDFINLPKNHPDRKRASLVSADAAIKFLEEIKYPSDFYQEIHHAIVAHSFSANILPETIEAKIVQDADRLDGLGAIGIYRLFTVAASMNRDLKSSLEHVEDKLRIVSKNMKTTLGKKLADQRMQFIDSYLKQLLKETC